MKNQLNKVVLMLLLISFGAFTWAEQDYSRFTCGDGDIARNAGFRGENPVYEDLSSYQYSMNPGSTHEQIKRIEYVSLHEDLCKIANEINKRRLNPNPSAHQSNIALINVKHGRRSADYLKCKALKLGVHMKCTYSQIGPESCFIYGYDTPYACKSLIND